MSDDDERTDTAGEKADDEHKPQAHGAAQPPSRARPSAAGRARRIGGGLPTATHRTAPPGNGDPESRADAKTAVSVKKRPARDDAESPADTKAAASAKKRRKAVDATSDDETPAAVKPSKSPRRKTPAWVAWVPAGVFVVVAGVFLALLAVARIGGTSDPSTSTKQRETVLAAAKNCVAATNSYKYTDIDSYEQRGLQCATGTYAKQYKTAVDTLIKKNAPTQKFTQLAQVNVAGVESVTDNGKQWAVLVYGQLNITNASTPKGRIDPFSVVVTMEKPASKWLIGNVRLLSTP
ncbi:MAG: hypothetical protein ACR2LX_05100 [Jatrophihabitans sp.]